MVFFILLLSVNHRQSLFDDIITQIETIYRPYCHVIRAREILRMLESTQYEAFDPANATLPC